jgi:homoserine O-acetyltransferase/O-succinyltransferase
MRVEVAEPFAFTLELPALTLEAGAIVSPHRAFGMLYGPRADSDSIARGEPLDASLPAVLLVHPLTARPALDALSFFGGLIGKGRPLRPWAMRVLSLNLLGSCFGSSGPLDPAFPRSDADAGFPAPHGLQRRGDLGFAPHRLPATVTPHDQAASLAMALTKLGVARVRLVLGGSLGGMVGQCLAWRFPGSVETAVSIAAPAASTASMIAYNHVAREAILRDPSYPVARTGLSIARQLARLSYRSAGALERAQGRLTAGPAHEGHGAWNPRVPYRVQTYLRHAGDVFAEDFCAESYVCLSLAMDHHDLSRHPPAANFADMRFFNVRLDSDTLVSEESQARASTLFRNQGATVTDVCIQSPYGHDGFLVQQGAPLRDVVRAALA